jgi:hypothetical protein
MQGAYIYSDEHLLLWTGSAILFIFFIALFFIERYKKIK